LQEFRQTIDDYPNWLKSQEAPVVGESTAASQTMRSASKRQNRRTGARRRQMLKPHSDRVRKIEKSMSQHRMDMAAIENSLHDESLYTDAARKEEMTILLQQQAELKAGLEALEWQWLEASEALEKAEMNL